MLSKITVSNNHVFLIVIRQPLLKTGTLKTGTPTVLTDNGIENADYQPHKRKINLNLKPELFVTETRLFLS